MALAYGSAIPNPFQYDDLTYIVENEYVHRWPGPLRYLRPPCVDSNGMLCGFYRPLARLSFFASYQLSGPSAPAFRLANLALHAAVAILVWLLAARLLAALARQLRYPREAVALAAVVAGAIVATHPLANQTLNQISKRDTLLAVSLSLGALLAYLAALSRTTAPRGAWLRPLLLGGLLHALALTAKEIAVCVPLFVLCCDLLVARTPASRRRWVVHGVALALSSALVIAFAIWAAGHRYPTESRDGPLPGILEHVLTQPSVIVRYLGLLASPSGLSAYHEVPPVASPFSAVFILPALVLGVGVALAIALRRRAPEVGLAVLAALGSFAPTSLFPNNIAMEEDRAYLMLCWLGLGAAALLGRGIAHLGREHLRLARGLGVATAIGILLLSASSRARSADWATATRLWESAALVYPTSRVILLNYASALARADREADRFAVLARVAQLHPNDRRSRLFFAHALARAGRPADAERLAAGLLAEAPNDSAVLLLAGHLQRARGAHVEAEASYARALRADPASAIARIHLAATRLALGRRASAQRLLEGVKPYHRLHGDTARLLEQLRQQLR